MPNSQLLDILLIAMVAGIILFRLYSVLGRRTGHERPPDNYRAPGTGASMPPATKTALLPAGTAPEKPSDPVARALLDIKLADRNFETERFLDGARSAYKTILAAFAAGDRLALRPLLNDEVYSAFDAGIKARGQTPADSLAGFKTVRIVHASLSGKTAELTVSFTAQFRPAADETSALRDVTDVWTFSRDVRARDPNWTLVATSGDLA